MESDKPKRDRMKDGGRHSWRELSHKASHSQSESEALPPVQPHPLASGNPPVIVQTAESLAEMVDHLKAAGSFAFDSEFIGERSYEPHLCLVQAATRQEVFLVDPLAGLDLSAFWDLITCPTVEKIVLAGQQDFGPAVLRTGKAPANVMDLQIAAGFVHTDYPLSLVKLLAEFVGVSVGKGLTFTHWDNRPLSDVQVRYAADDVRYLPAARAVIADRLAELGRTAWARQECASALEDISFYRPAPQMLYLRVRGRDRLSRPLLAVLRELAIVRDQAARTENVPPRTLLRDEILVAMARRPAATLADLDDIKGLPRAVESKYGPQIVEAVARATALPQDQWPPKEPAEQTAFHDLIDKAVAEINRFCIERSIAPALVASRKDVARAYRALADGQPAQARLLGGWRKELLGQLLEKHD